jgi:two-component system, OmpR family, osmolarity sensor histidine kinase EnvZ
MPETPSTSLQTGLQGSLKASVKPLNSIKKRIGRAIASLLPKGLYARALLIIIAPMVLLQSIIAYTFMERHWQLVTRRLSSAVTADIAALIDIYEAYPQHHSRTQSEAEALMQIAANRLNLDVDVMSPGLLPPPNPKPFFSILDEALSEELARQISKPYWIDTVGRSNLIEIRVKLDTGIIRVFARRSQAYASNSHIFLVWMAGSSVVLLSLAIVILRNQIRPILRLAEAAESFGKGREVEFRPRGAREVRQAGHAFIEMKRRIERAMEQRTMMLSGVSHDLRTILTRFKLSLALIEQGPEVEDLKKDVDEMSRMLEGYLAFARGDDAVEQAIPTHLHHLLDEMSLDAERQGHPLHVHVEGEPVIMVRPGSFRRALLNLIANAGRHGTEIRIHAVHEARWLTLCVDDNGPGIAPHLREEVFKPFMRLDEARNQDEGGSGLGLSIARDAIRAQGGDITLQESPMGGLRALVRLPA